MADHQQNRDPGRRSQGKERLEPTTSPQVADVQHDPVLCGQPVMPAQRSFLGLVAGTEPARVDTAPDQLGVNAVSADGRDLPLGPEQNPLGSEPAKQAQRRTRSVVGNQDHDHQWRASKPTQEPRPEQAGNSQLVA